MEENNLRILVIADNRAIRKDFGKFLAIGPGGSQRGGENGAWSDDAAGTPGYQLDFARRGEEGGEKVRAAVQEDRSYAVAFVDVGAPPGSDAAQTVENIRAVDGEIQIVICIGGGNDSAPEIQGCFGGGDRLLILKKPFTAAEVQQLACALTEKWRLARPCQFRFCQVKKMMAQRRVELASTTGNLVKEMAQRRRAEQALNTSEERYRASFDKAAVGKAEVDPATARFLVVNQKMCEMTGYSSSELLARTAVDVIHPDDRPGFAALQMRVALAQADDYSIEHRLLRSDGQVVWVQATGQIVRDPQRRPLSVMVVLQDVTARHHAEEALRFSEEQYRADFNMAAVGKAHTDPRTLRLLKVNRKYCEITGYSSVELLQRTVMDLVHPEDRQKLEEHRGNLANIQRKEFTVEHRLIRRDGQIIWVQVTGAHVCDADGAPRYGLTVIQDVTARRRAEEALRLSEEQYRASFELAAVGCTEVDTETGRFLRVNRRFCAMTGFSAAELLQRTTADTVHPDDRQAYKEYRQRALDGQAEEYHCEPRLLRRDGGIIRSQVTAAIVRDARRRPLKVIAVIQDVTAQRMAEEQLRHDAYHDALTDLPNRAALLDNLKRCLAQSHRTAEEFAVLLLDLKRFKLINDSLGHALGDQLLVAVAQRLQTCLRKIDLVARATDGQLSRLDGDQFVVLLERVHNLSEVLRVTQRLHEALALPFSLAGNELFAHISVGIVLSRKQYAHPEEVLRDAGTALHQAKAAGNGGDAVFGPAMHASALRRWQTETALRKAITAEDFHLVYQPIVSLQTGRVCEMEALLRWQPADGQAIGPGEFIPVAEESGLIVPLGQWVFKQACRQIKQWFAQGPQDEDFAVAVNVSGVQLACPAAVDQLIQTFRQSALDPGRLHVELTESAIVQNGSVAMAGLTKLRDAGLQLHLDDFGTGYSSLSYLHRLPLHGLKIDRSFVATLETNPSSQSIVRVIIALARIFGLGVIAEGIETEAQLKALREMGCEKGQGYYFAKPLSADDAAAFLQRDALPWPAAGEKKLAG